LAAIGLKTAAPDAAASAAPVARASSRSTRAGSRLLETSSRTVRVSWTRLSAGPGEIGDQLSQHLPVDAPAAVHRTDLSSNRAGQSFDSDLAEQVFLE
jgi:hypothetical protein